MSQLPALQIEDDPKAEDILQLQERLYEFNAGAVGARDGRYLSIFVRDETGELLGGLHGWTWVCTLGVDVLWVREDQRRRGLGRRLLEAAEAEAIRRGCGQAFLQTHSYQAPAFYARLGWEALAEVPGYPEPTTRVMYRKRLV